MHWEPTLAERLDARAAAKRALMEGLKPKPSVKTDDPYRREREQVERIAALRVRKKPKAPQIAQEAPEAVIRAVEEPEPHPPSIEPVRYSVEASEECGIIVCEPVVVRRKGITKAWRIREWKAGNRNCFYCGVKTVLGAVGKGKRAVAKQNASPPRNLATVDHREPLVLGGDDAAWNWAIACWLCNNSKGSMTEAEFRATLVLAAE